MMYFRPDQGVIKRDTRGWVAVPDAHPEYRNVTHLRQVPFRAGTVTTDGRTLEGFAAVFDTETVIDSWWEGRFREVFRKGAFAQTIVEDRQIIQFDHGMNFTEPGEKPIGAVETLEETDEGLHIRATLRDTWDVQPVRDAIADGSVSGMSIAFRVREEKITEGDLDTGELDLREVLNVQLFEAGPVTWPAYPTTTVQVKNKVLEQSSDIISPTLEGLPDGAGIPTEPEQLAARVTAARTRLILDM